MDELRFDGRTVVVTGAGRGIGRCHALLFASRGANVVIADFGGELDGSGGSSGPADDCVKEILATGGDAVACYADVADEAGAAAIVATALDAFGRLDVVVNNAGISDPGLFRDLSTAQFRRMVDVHYLGTVYVTKAAWPHLQAAGYGRVVNTTSEAAFGIMPKLTSYGAAKGAVFAFTRALATEGAANGILVNAVAPRAQTRMSDPSEMAKHWDVRVEEGPPMPPEEVSTGAAYLAHESCRLNGEVLAVGYGMVQRVAIVESAGLTSAALSPEAVAEHIDTILDLNGATTVALGSYA